jgi:hypothetical protein
MFGASVNQLVLQGKANLGKVLNSPHVSTVPTPATESKANIRSLIDNMVGFSTSAQNMGLIPPSVSKPGTGPATAGTKSKLPGVGWLVVFALVAVVAFRSMK